MGKLENKVAVLASDDSRFIRGIELFVDAAW
jgi:hypothetical protein